MNENQGFTLIELLVVVLIIGILASVALPQYQVAVAKSRFSSLLAAGKAIKEAENLYYLANNQYTQQFEELDFGPSGTLSSNGSRVNFGAVSCGLITGGGYKEFNCSYTDNSSVPMLLSSFDSVGFSCRVYGTNDVATKVCLAMGGVKTGCNSGENYCQYKLSK